MNADDLPHLNDFAQAYFHQDWPEASGPTWEAVVDHFVRDADDADVAELVAELDRVLAEADDDDALVTLLAAVDLNYAVDRTEVRQWLRAMRNRIWAP